MKQFKRADLLLEYDKDFQEVQADCVSQLPTDWAENYKSYIHHFNEDTRTIISDIKDNIDYIKDNYHNKKYVFECLDDIADYIDDLQTLLGVK